MDYDIKKFINFIEDGGKQIKNEYVLEIRQFIYIDGRFEKVKLFVTNIALNKKCKFNVYYKDGRYISENTFPVFQESESVLQYFFPMIER